MKDRTIDRVMEKLTDIRITGLQNRLNHAPYNGMLKDFQMAKEKRDEIYRKLFPWAVGRRVR